MLIGKEQLLGLSLPTVDVPVPELGEGAAVRLRVMTGEQRDKWDLALGRMGEKKDHSGVYAVLVALCAVDEQGKPVFTEKELGQCHAGVVRRLFDAAHELNKLGGEAVKETAKNSPSEGS